MTDGEVSFGELDRLDAAWDELNRGRTIDSAEITAVKSLLTLAEVSPQIGRQIWANASTQSRLFAHGARQNAPTPGGGTLHHLAPAASGWGWLPAGAVAVAASVAILAGILLGQNDGNGVTATLPSADASSVVATLPSSAPAWATPGSISAD